MSDGQFGFLFATLLVIFFGSVVVAAINSDEENWIKDGNCVLHIYEHRSWSFEDYTTVKTYCLEES